MISDLESCDIMFYKPSDTLWKNLSEQVSQITSTQGVKNVQSQDELNEIFSGVLGFKNLNTDIPLWLYYNYLKDKDIFGILELTKALPSNKYDFNPSTIIGRPKRNNEKIINWDYLITVDTIQTLASINPSILTDSLNICEIGAGWGRVAYYLTQVNKNLSYHIFDIPHVLYVSHEYLIKNVKHTEVYDYKKSKKQLKENIFKSGIFFHTPHFLEHFNNKTFDFTINIASFQEMNFRQVEGYFKKINETSKILYTQQRYFDLDMRYDKYPNFLNWEKVLDKDVNFHPLWFEQAFIIK